MEGKDQFSDWFDGVKEKLSGWGEQLEEFFHRGIQVAPSGKWMTWVTVITPNTCEFCKETHGKIIDPADPATFPEFIEGIPIRPPVHPNCHCTILPLPTMKAGTATQQGEEGADWYLMLFGDLPSNYMSKQEAYDRGWRSKKGNLDDIAPGAMIGGEIYWNGDGHLPDAPGRVWYEADINYTHGFRGRHRVVYSNDGLLFITYDHFETFIEIVK